MEIGTLSVIGIAAAGSFIVMIPCIKLALELAPYIYSSTRVSARSGLILNNYDELIATNYPKEIYAILEDTAYNYVVEHSNGFDSFSKQLEKDLFKTYCWLEKIVPKDIAPLIKALKMKFEISEIKEVINDLKSKKKVDELYCISDEDLKMEIEETNDFNSLKAIIQGTKYGSCFQKETTSEINTALDSFYYRSVLAEINNYKDKKPFQAFLDYWRFMIDIINIRLTQRRINGSSLSLIDGGYIEIKEFNAINDISQLENLLEQKLNIQLSETELYKLLLKKAKEIGVKYNLTSGNLIKFIVQKEIENRNLNILLKLKTEKFPKEEIQKLIIKG